MKPTTAREIGRTVRLAMGSWSHTLRLATLVAVVIGLFIASRRLPLITW